MTFKIVSQTVTAKPQQLKAEWTYEQEAIADILSKELQDEINREIMNSIMAEHYIQQGWSSVEMKELNIHGQAVDVIAWLKENEFVDTVTYVKLGSMFLFRRAEDATMFRLKWA